MKSKKINLLLVGAAVIGFGTIALYAFTGNKEQAQASAAAVVENEDVYQGPPVHLYKTAAPKLLDNASFDKLANKSLKSANLRGARLGNSLRIESKEDATIAFEQNNDGSIRFNASLKKYAEAFKPKLPTEQQMDEIARNYLKENNLLPSDALKVGHIGGVRASKAGTTETIDKMRTITYIREIDGIPVVGPGSKIIVHVGDNNEITGLIHRWKQLDAAPTSKRALPVTELRGEKEAKEELTRRVQADWGKNAKVHIEESKVAYFDSNDGYIQPVYVFKSTITPDGTFDPAKKGLENQEYLGFIPAMKSPAERLDREDAPPANAAVKEMKFDAAKDGARKGKAEGEGK